MEGQAISRDKAKRGFFGFSWGDIIGVLIMLIPLYITLRFQYLVPGKRFWFIQISREQTLRFKPGMISMLLTMAFYVPFLVRYRGMFTVNSLPGVLLSVIRTALNSWVIASFISILLPTVEPRGGFTLMYMAKNRETLYMLLAILLSWLGMKTVAGYSWALFIAASWKQLLKFNGAMGTQGAVLVLAFVISMLLQISAHVDLREFAKDFRGGLEGASGRVRGDLNAARRGTSRWMKRIRG